MSDKIFLPNDYNDYHIFVALQRFLGRVQINGYEINAFVTCLEKLQSLEDEAKERVKAEAALYQEKPWLNPKENISYQATDEIIESAQDAADARARVADQILASSCLSDRHRKAVSTYAKYNDSGALGQQDRALWLEGKLLLEEMENSDYLDPLGLSGFLQLNKKEEQ